MSASGSDRWHWAAFVHDDIYRLPLSQCDRDCYFYICAYCTKRWQEISAVVMARVLHRKRALVLKSLHRIEAMNMIGSKRASGNRRLYIVKQRRGNKEWGVLPATLYPSGHKLVSNGAQSLVANGTQSLYPSGHHDCMLRSGNTARLGSQDSNLLSLVLPFYRSWKFSRRPIGARSTIGNAQQGKLIEMMRALSAEICEIARLEAILRAVGDYLDEPRDVVSMDGRDHRAHSPMRWLERWQEQLHFARQYLETKERNIVAITAP